MILTRRHARIRGGTGVPGGGRKAPAWFVRSADHRSGGDFNLNPVYRAPITRPAPVVAPAGAQVARQMKKAVLWTHDG